MRTKINLTDRGRIQVGLAADITVFDPNTIIDHATFVEPHKYAEGVSYVIVNGQVVLDAVRAHRTKLPDACVARAVVISHWQLAGEPKDTLL